MNKVIWDMTIEEIDSLLEKIKKIRRKKIDEELEKLNSARERVMKLKKSED